VNRSTTSRGLVLSVPTDHSEVLTETSEDISLWELITPIARSQFICWVENVKPKKPIHWRHITNITNTNVTIIIPSKFLLLSSSLKK